MAVVQDAAGRKDSQFRVTQPFGASADNGLPCLTDGVHRQSVRKVVVSTTRDRRYEDVPGSDSLHQLECYSVLRRVVGEFENVGRQVVAPGGRSQFFGKHAI